MFKDSFLRGIVDIFQKILSLAGRCNKGPRHWTLPGEPSCRATPTPINQYSKSLSPMLATERLRLSVRGWIQSGFIICSILANQRGGHRPSPITDECIRTACDIRSRGRSVLSSI